MLQHVDVFSLECSLYGIIQLPILTFVLWVSADGKGVGRERGLDLGVGEVKHTSIIFDHIHLLYALDTVHTKLLQTILNRKVKNYINLQVTKIIKSFVVIPELSYHQSLSCERSSFFFSKFPFPQSEHSEASRAFPC